MGIERSGKATEDWGTITCENKFFASVQSLALRKIICLIGSWSELRKKHLHFTNGRSALSNAALSPPWLRPPAHPKRSTTNLEKIPGTRRNGSMQSAPDGRQLLRAIAVIPK